MSGTVKAVEPRPFSMGGTMMSVVIENDFQNTVCPDIHPVDDPDSLTPEQLVEIVKNAGIVGQGGATFPTHVKISSGLGKVDYVIINAAECEPYITGDHRTCLERPEQVIKGDIAIIKHTDDGETQIETPESGAEFQVFLKSAGSYENAKESERDVLVCDENGFAQSKKLPYGTYIVRQTKGWEGRELMDLSLIHI
mgnify:CR=1 FL=1